MSDACRIMFAETGGPEVLRREAITLADPGAGGIRVLNRAVGVNFIDVYHRTGLYPLPLPSGIGSEAAGIVEAVGDGVDTPTIGTRVAYLAPKPGSYATHLVLPATRAVALPDGVSDEIAAAALLKGLTTWMLVERIARAGSGSVVLVHAAAGGVGSIAVQWLKAIGATVIAHAGTPEKAERAKALGADHALACPFDALADRVHALTDGRGVDAVLDGVGKASWEASLKSVRKRGIIASYGNASGPVPPVSPRDLMLAGSVFLTRPTLFDYTSTADELQAGADRLFALIGDGSITVPIGQRYPLADAAKAHRALEARETTGSSILLP